MPSQSPKPSHTTPNHDLLVRAVILIFIGLILVIAPHFMAASPTRALFQHAQVPAWFALVLGTVFGVQYLLRRRKAAQY